MKQFKQILFLLLCFAAANAANAQVSTDDWSYTTYQYMGKYPGYVVLNSGDTLKGYVQLNDQVANQEKCLFFANETDRKPKEKYSGDDLKCYSVADKFYTSAQYANLLNKKKSFILVMSEGHIHHLKWYWIDENVYPHVLKFDDILQNGNDKPVNPDKFIFFAKNMSEYISDDTELAEKIKDKEKGYGLIHMYDIINEYNTWWDKNKKK